MADNKLEDLDPIFKSPPASQKAPSTRKKGREEYTGPLPQVPEAPSEKKLENFDEIFKPGPTTTGPAPGATVAPAIKKSPIDKDTSALLGAGVGYALNREPFPRPMARDARIQDLKITSTLGQQAAQDASSDILRLRTRQQTLEIALDDAQRALQAARERAVSYGLPSEISPEGTAAGDKWSKKVVGGMGPGGESVTEATRGYRMQQGLNAAGEGAAFRASRSGLIVPNKPEFMGQFTSPVQEQAYKQLLEAQAKYDATAQALNQNKLQLEQLSQGLTKTQTTASNAGKRAAMLEEMNKPSFTSRLGRAVKSIPFGSVLGGGMAGYEGVQAWDELQQGNIPGAVMHGLSGAGGALMTLPHPAAKGAGLLLSAPPLMYEGYKAFTGQDPLQTTMPTATPPAQ